MDPIRNKVTLPYEKTIDSTLSGYDCCYFFIILSLIILKVGDLGNIVRSSFMIHV
jgi:hypothetical protein